MIRKALAIMTDPALTISIAPAGEVVVFDYWGCDKPDMTGLHAIKVEPRRWWIIGAGAALDDTEKTLSENGVLTPIGGGLMRAKLIGPGWRSRLMTSAVFNAEDLSFTSGDCVATIIHHTSVVIDVISANEAHVYFAASQLGDIEHLWEIAGYGP
jgi:sarcosine oxidase gamma subunit